MRQKAYNSFYYLPEVNLFPEYDKRANRQEIDILCVMDGKFVAVEAKRSASQFCKGAGEVDNFVKKIDLINPDVAFLSFEQYCEGSETDIASTKECLREAVEKIKNSIKPHIVVKIAIAADLADFNEHPDDLGICGKRVFEFFDKIDRKQ